MGPSVVPNFEFFWCSILWTMTKQDIYYTRFLAMEAVGMKITSAHAATLLAKYDKRTRAAWWSSMSSSSSARGSRQPWDSTSPGAREHN